MSFETALPVVLKEEGGFADDPADPGGRTMHGVTQKVYDAYRNKHGQPVADVLNITDDELADLYRTDYWLPARCDRLPAPLDLVHFDCAVNSGLHQAALLLQRACGVEDDGDIGPVTLGAAAQDPTAKAKAYLILRRTFYTDLTHTRPGLGKFLAGWLKRCDHIAHAAGLAT